MTTRGKTILGAILVFVLGMVAGSGLGVTYGRSTADAALRQQAADLETQYRTINDNYLIVVREYNKLFGIKAAAGGVAPAAMKTESAAAPAVQVPAMQAPAAQVTTAPAEPAAAAPTTETTPEPVAAPAAGALTAEFEGLTVEGTGPQEGPPPLTVKFADKSTGNITSWEWTFGDGATSTEQHPEHIYKECPLPLELCTVKLKVCGPDGCAETEKVEYIWVSESCTGC